MNVVKGLVLSVAALLLSMAAIDVHQTVPATEPKAAQAFEQYEHIRALLSADSLDGVSASATALAPLAGGLAGTAAEAAARKLADAKRLKDAREDFGALSEVLVPKFLAANLPGVRGFMCPMVKKTWAQKGDTAHNPYLGTSMPTCGTPITR